jgi:hypothetical protein
MTTAVDQDIDHLRAKLAAAEEQLAKSVPKGDLLRAAETAIAAAVAAEREALRNAYSLDICMKIAGAGFLQWAGKSHNAKWARKIDGTPIPNDLPMVIAEQFADAISALIRARSTEEG